VPGGADGTLNVKIFTGRVKEDMWGCAGDQAFILRDNPSERLRLGGNDGTTSQSDVIGTVDDDASVQDAIVPLVKVEAGVEVAASGQPLWGAWKLSKFPGQISRFTRLGRLAVAGGHWSVGGIEVASGELAALALVDRLDMDVIRVVAGGHGI